MDAYTEFARVYDRFMDNVPYEEWCDYICNILSSKGINDGLVLDLGCGTGVMTRLLRDKGYDMIGIDLSAEMLEIAREQDDTGILYLQQDMREFELYGTVSAIVCLCDSMNYLLEEQDLAQVFSLVHNYLDPGGIFIFDMNTLYKYQEVIGDATICENREHESFIWENYFDEETCINEYALTLFIEQEQGLFARYEEFHYQRAYEIEKVKALIKQSGLKLLAVYGEGTYETPDEDCERVYFVTEKESIDIE
jgi:SAM-dependent methyltransferase